MQTTGAVCKTIQDFRRLGRYIQGSDYIIGLGEELLQQKTVAIEAAQLYLVQGHYIKAWEVCQLAFSPIFQNGDSKAAFTLEIFDLDSVVLALLASYIEISRYGRLKTALHIADRVYDAWLTPTPTAEVQNDIPVKAREHFATIVAGQWCALQDAGDERAHQGTVVTEHRILIEFYYHKIRVVAAEQSLLDEATTKQNAADRLDLLRAWAISKGRLREARYLTYFRIDLVKDNTKDTQILRDFLRVLYGTNHPIEEAQTHLDLAKCMLSSGESALADEAQEHINKAKKLFKDEEHVFGLLDLMDMQIGEKKGTQVKSLLDWKLECADSYLKSACYQQGIKCLTFSIPLNHDMREVFQKTQSIIERARSEITRVGAVLLEQGLFVNAVAQTLVRAPEYGYARAILEEYLNHPPDEIGPKVLSYLYTLLRGAYANLGNLDEAMSYAEQALIASLQGVSYIDRSDAAFYLAITNIERGRKLPEKSPLTRLWFANSITFLSGWVHIDQFMAYRQQEVEKRCSLASIENQLGHMFDDQQAFTRSDEWLCTARECSSLYGIKSNQLTEIEIARASRTGDFDLAITIASDRLHTLEADPVAAPFNLAQAASAASMMCYQRYCFRKQTLPTQSEADARFTFQDLLDALELASQAFELYKTAGGSEAIVRALNWLYDLVRHFPTDVFLDLLKEFLLEADKIEAFCDAVRRSSASTNGTSSLLEKRSIISEEQFRIIYSNAIEICLDLDDLPTAWVWIQKSKARALSEIFGSRALIPPTLLQTIVSDPEARALYEKERLSTEDALKGGPLAYLDARRQAESIRTEMRKHPHLSQMLDIREGAFNVEFHESELVDSMKLSNMNPDSIKYVDWFISTSRGQENKIVRLVRQPNGTTSSKILAITSTTVERWKSRIFNFPEEAEPPLRRDDARGRLRELAHLIAGLEQTTNEGDLLILSPSGILNGIPLHGLQLGKRSLIERNPVIYSSSAALFRHCHMHAATRASNAAEHHDKAAFLAVYESSTPEGQAEQAQIYSHAHTVNTKPFPFSVHTGSAVTKPCFVQTARTTSWVHYHGHALFDKRDPLQSSLVLSPTATSTSSPPPPPDPSTNLTAADIFTISLLSTAPHFTIIACDSGTQDIAPGDEPLGIVSALLYAGATSVVGALWPVDSHTARKFTDIFYEDLRRQVESQSRRAPVEQRFLVLNLATALQNTVMKMMDRNSLETKAPLHWAGYVLHGAWFHVYPRAHLDIAVKVDA